MIPRAFLTSTLGRPPTPPEVFLTILRTQEFLETMHQFSQQGEEEKLSFLFKVYDPNGDPPLCAPLPFHSSR